MEEAIFLTKFASQVTVVHRRHELRASKIMQDRAMKNPKIDFGWNVEVKEFFGDKVLKGAKVHNNETGEDSEISCDGAFLGIGHTPATKIFAGALEMTEKGYIKRSEYSMSSVPGVFVAGDVYDFRYMQAVTAAGMGCEAAIDAERWLEEQHSAE